jgi:hypothetical protein
MAGYSYIGQVTDPNAKKALQVAYDLIGTLTQRLAALEAGALQGGAPISVNGQRVTNLGDPQAESDAATVAFVRSFSQALTEARIGGVTAAVDTVATPTLTVKNGLITGAA